MAQPILKQSSNELLNKIMAQPGKTKFISARAHPEQKKAIRRIARARGESAAVIFREALNEYIKRKEKEMAAA